MVNRYKYKDATWVDLVEPTAEEIRSAMEEFSFSPSVASELTSPSVRSRADYHKDYIYTILHFPAIRLNHGTKRQQEVDFIIGKNFLVTARYGSIEAIEKFAKILEVNTVLDKEFSENCSGVLFFGIIEEIYRSLSNELEYIENWIQATEELIFKGKEKEMVTTLSEISRTLLNFKKITDLHNEVWDSLKIYGQEIFDGHFTYHVQSTISEYKKIYHMLRNNMDSLVELRETNNSLVSTKQNEVMKVLTILAFVTFPLSLIAGIFGMNTEYIPFVGNSYDFWIVIAIMLVATTCMFTFFKHKRWL